MFKGSDPQKRVDSKKGSNERGGGKEKRSHLQGVLYSTGRHRRSSAPCLAKRSELGDGMSRNRKHLVIEA